MFLRNLTVAVLFFCSVSDPLCAQTPDRRLSFGAGVGIKGAVAVAEFRPVGPVWISGRFTANTTLVQKAGGVRVDVSSKLHYAIYLQGLIGTARCYYELSGSGGFCDSPTVDRTGLTFGAGYEGNLSKDDSWRYGVEGGLWRGLKDDAASADLEHWFGNIIIKRRLRFTSPS